MQANFSGKKYLKGIMVPFFLVKILPGSRILNNEPAPGTNPFREPGFKHLQRAGMKKAICGISGRIWLYCFLYG